MERVVRNRYNKLTIFYKTNIFTKAKQNRHYTTIIKTLHSVTVTVKEWLLLIKDEEIIN